MSNLSVNTASSGVVAPVRATGNPSEIKGASDAGAGASAKKSASVVDPSNYIASPKGVVDPASGVFILQYRDGSTGEVTRQYPSEKVVAAYQRGEAKNNVAAVPSQPVVSSLAQSGSAHSASPSSAPSVPSSVSSASVSSVVGGSTASSIGTGPVGGLGGGLGGGQVTTSSSSSSIPSTSPSSTSPSSTSITV